MHDYFTNLKELKTVICRETRIIYCKCKYLCNVLILQHWREFLKQYLSLESYENHGKNIYRQRGVEVRNRQNGGRCNSISLYPYMFFLLALFFGALHLCLLFNFFSFLFSVYSVIRCTWQYYLNCAVLMYSIISWFLAMMFLRQNTSSEHPQ